MRLLVAGGAGFIGSHFVSSVLDNRYPALAGAEVTVVDAFTYAGRRANLAQDGPRLRIVAADITDADAMLDLLRGHDAIVNFAAESHVDRSIADGVAFVRTNVAGTQSLLEAARRNGVPVFVQVSTDEVYGSMEEDTATESYPLVPSSPYAASKAAGDLMALAYHRTHGLDVRITRCTNTFGPRQFPEKLIPLAITELLKGGKVRLYGDGLNVREWLHVDDHCNAVRLVLEKGRSGTVYNVAGGTEMTNRDLVGLLIEQTGAVPDAIERAPDRPAHDRRYSIDWTRIQEELGFAPERAFSPALAETVDWYRDNPDWWAPIAGGGAR
ncbi:dTDP-glucose 4,6-dehydratase [Spinactinospora alkalitolerans]|uniref:dTDP-glucose 4,6-dehydratase n=1 Tax=Spinactinospora alkalitolerans TaxID=687207 RepID=A0A852TPL7_9ACTN|nr:dTDP-glucose 4,6-dehydratase [Spinactinospora alkalitolerans]NYE45421.1 dTDP-glucose 4,6-dehydratase [Spinactinospora alkalitolerans]